MKCLLLFVLSCFLLSDVEAWWRPPPRYPTYPQPQQPPTPPPAAPAAPAAPQPQYPGQYSYPRQMLPLMLAQQQAAGQLPATSQLPLMMALGGMGGMGGAAQSLIPHLLMNPGLSGGVQSMLPWLLMNQAGGAGGGLNNLPLYYMMTNQGMMNNPMMAYYLLNQHQQLNAGRTGNSEPPNDEDAPANECTDPNGCP